MARVGGASTWSLTIKNQRSLWQKGRNEEELDLSLGAYESRKILDFCYKGGPDSREIVRKGWWYIKQKAATEKLLDANGTVDIKRDLETEKRLDRMIWYFKTSLKGSASGAYAHKAEQE